MKLSKMFEGYTLHAQARALSPRTISNYKMALNLFIRHAGDVDISHITREDLQGFFASLVGTVKPHTIWTYHVGMASVFTWAASEGMTVNHMAELRRPTFHPKDVIPYTKSEVTAMLGAVRDLDTETRNRAILLTLLDTGLRASELIDLVKGDLDFKGQALTVRSGKGAKSRQVPFSPITGKSLWAVVTGRSEAEHVFVTDEGKPLSRGYLLHVIRRIGDRAGVSQANCHRFRHTFAVEFLRENPNVFALQKMLGHSSLDMVKIYLSLAQTDIDQAHKLGSPVTKWLS